MALSSEWAYVYQVGCDLCQRRVAPPARKKRAAIALAKRYGFDQFWKQDEPDGEKSVWACRSCAKDPRIVASLRQAPASK